MKTERLLITTGSLCLVSFDFLIMTSHMHDHATVFKRIEIKFILAHRHICRNRTYGIPISIY